MIPNPKEWRKYFATRKKTAINLIIAKVIEGSNYNACVKKTKKALKKDAEMIELASKAYKKYEKSLKKKI